VYSKEKQKPRLGAKVNRDFEPKTVEESDWGLYRAPESIYEGYRGKRGMAISDIAR
jgi:hypothetical protein